MLSDRGWTIWLLPLFSSLLCWVAAPGDIGFWPLGFVALLPLFLFLQRAVERNFCRFSLFLGGFIYGTALFLLLLYWLVNVIVHYGGLPVTVAAGGLLLLSCYMGCYTGVFLLCCLRLVSSFSAMALLFLLPSLWIGLEWLRGWLFTGFPWLDLGCYPAFSPWFLQGAVLFGHYGLGWLLVFINIALWLCWVRKEKTVIVACAFSVLVSYALFSLFSFTREQNSLEKWVLIRPGIVQGNVPQDRKWVAAEQQQTVSAYLSLSKELVEASSPPDFLVWPETALPFYPQQSSLTGQLLSFIRQENLPLVSGAPWYEIDRRNAAPAFYNAALLLTPKRDAPLAGLIYKTHLVPFGEYVPLQDFLPFLRPLVESVGNLSAGEIRTPLHIETAAGKSAAAGVLVCFESVFPNLSRHWVDTGADILLNLTNDAWYGKTSAPRHTLAMTVLRAVETRRSIVRAANTGFSAFIYPSGKVFQQTEWFTEAAVKMEMPLRKERTLYVRIGWLFAPFCFFLSLVCVVWRGPLWKKLVATRKA